MVPIYFSFFTIEYYLSPPHILPLSCVQEMTRGNRYKTIHWRFVESLEPPRVVHARCPDMVTKGNLYGQVTVRMHSKQVRFGKWITFMVYAYMCM